jgi:hypothetical protein
MPRDAESSDLRSTLQHGAVMAGIVLAIVFGWRWTQRDVNFCRQAFRELAYGSRAAEDHIAWEQLNALGTDVALDYLRFSDEKERSDYRRAFVLAFAQAFKKTGGTVDAYVNWRVVDRTPEQITVAADHHTKKATLLLVLPADGRRQLVGVQWDRACPTCGFGEKPEGSG